MLANVPGGWGASTTVAADLLQLQQRCAAAKQVARAHASKVLAACTTPPSAIKNANWLRKDTIFVGPLADAPLPVASRALATLLQVKPLCQNVWNVGLYSSADALGRLLHSCSSLRVMHVRWTYSIFLTGSRSLLQPTCLQPHRQVVI